MLYDTLLYANKHLVPDLLLVVDFEKTFDSVAWAYTEKSVSKCMFGKDITTMDFAPTLIHVCM